MCPAHGKPASRRACLLIGRRCHRVDCAALSVGDRADDGVVRRSTGVGAEHAGRKCLSGGRSVDNRLAQLPHRALRRVHRQLEADLAGRDRRRDAEAPRHGRRPPRQPAAARAARESEPHERHRPLRQPDRLRARRSLQRGERHRQPADPPPAHDRHAGRDLHRQHRRVLQQARHHPGAHAGEQRRRALAEHLVLLADGAGRGGLPAPPDHPSAEGLRGRPQGGVRQAREHHVDGAAVSRQHRRHRLLAGEPARDLPEQHPPRERPEPGAALAAEDEPARGLLRRAAP